MIRDGIKKILFLTLLLSTLSYASDDALRQAEIYYDAQDFAQARNQYELLQADYLPDWQQAIIAYDIGTVLLGENKWKEAASYFKKAVDLQVQFPLLNYYLLKNIILTNILFVQEQISQQKKSSEADLKAYHESLTLLRTTMLDLSDLAKASCDLEKSEGLLACQLNPEVVMLRSKAKSLQESLQEQYQAYFLNHAALQGKLGRLWAAENKILQHLKYLQLKNLSPAFQPLYLAAYITQANSWEPLWENVKKIMEGAGKDQQAFFQKAHQNFSEGINLFETKDFTDVRQKMEASQEALAHLLTLTLQNSSLEEILKILSENYALALGQDPLQEMSLETLISLQSPSEGVVKAKGSSNDIEGFEKSQKYLKEAMDEFSDSLPIQARMLLEVAFYYEKQIHPPIAKDKDGADRLLNIAVNNEEISLNLNQLLMRALQQEQVSSKNALLPLELHEKALQIAQDFSKAALEQQKREFNEKNTANRPWNDIITLARERTEFANQATEFLKKQDLVKGMQLQESAIDKWKQALDKLQSSTAEQSALQSSEQQPAASTPKDDSLNSVLKQIQEMEIDDRSKPELISVPSAEGEKRPW